MGGIDDHQSSVSCLEEPSVQQYGLQKQIEAVKGTRTVKKKERDAFCIEYIRALRPFVA